MQRFESLCDKGQLSLTDIALRAMAELFPGAAGTVPEPDGQDGARLLWQRLKTELQEDESDFKHRICALDHLVKISDRLGVLSGGPAEDYIPFSAVSSCCPWHGCKYAASAVLHLLSDLDAESKRKAITPIARSLGGCTIPPNDILSATRWPYKLSEDFANAKLAVEKGTCTALHINVNDVEIMRNPGDRPGTFAHSCVMTVSPLGVHLFQSYGPRGYTLRQNIEEHDDKYPLSLDEGVAWVQRFEVFAADLGGMWSSKTNSAYRDCFGVDLIELGNMREGSQMDLYVDVKSFPFTAGGVQANFALLPQPSRSKIPCPDGKDAKSGASAMGRFRPDGGVPHYYVPTVLRCAFCGTAPRKGCDFQKCSRCKVVRYCGEPCQVNDWKARHKKVCKSLASI